MADSKDKKERDEVVCEEIIQCRRRRGVIEYQVNLTSKHRDWKEVWVPGRLLPQKSCLTFLQKLKKKHPDHWIFERANEEVDDGACKVEMLRALAHVQPVEKVLGYLVDDEDPTKMKPRMERSELDAKLAALPLVSDAHMQLGELLAETIDSVCDLRSKYESWGPNIPESIHQQLEERLNKQSTQEKKRITLSTNLKRTDAQSLRKLRYTDRILTSFVRPSIYELLDKLEPCTCDGVDECRFGECDHYKAYDENGRLKDKYLFFPRQRSVHECNRLCKCGPSCPNRVVQNGSTVSKEIFSTVDIGLGVRTNEFVRKGTFLGTYAGQLVEDYEHSEYVFELYSHPKGFSIDASETGNLTRFMNHSCEANVSTIPVQTSCSHPFIHSLAFFASTNIQEGEELLVNYGKPYFSALRMLCRCAARSAVPHKPFHATEISSWEGSVKFVWDSD